MRWTFPRSCCGSNRDAPQPFIQLSIFDLQLNLRYRSCDCRIRHSIGASLAGVRRFRWNIFWEFAIEQTPFISLAEMQRRISWCKRQPNQWSFIHFQSWALELPTRKSITDISSAKIEDKHQNTSIFIFNSSQAYYGKNLWVLKPQILPYLPTTHPFLLRSKYLYLLWSSREYLGWEGCEEYMACEVNLPLEGWHSLAFVLHLLVHRQLNFW